MLYSNLGRVDNFCSLFNWFGMRRVILRAKVMSHAQIWM